MSKRKRKDDECPFSFYFTMGSGSNAESQKFMHGMLNVYPGDKYADILEFTDRKGNKVTALVIAAVHVDRVKAASWLSEYHTPEVACLR